ncbi:MAG: class I SAM-dependent methyltransferase [Alphaproteobacteria bacterium]|nr:class I SAM-dependent methyltransferase [Alphaproteobacteria bacterium]
MKEHLALTVAWPAPLRRLVLEGRRALLRGDRAAADHWFTEALAVEPNIPEAHVGLSLARRPGPDYRAWLARLHIALKPGVYVEIGVEAGRTFGLVQADTLAIGIDPAADVPRLPVKGQVYRVTSEEFFASILPTLPAALQQATQHIDLAFIDGDHRFASALHDFIALEARMTPGGVIVLHDTWPLSQHTAQPERATGFYTGDVWKLVPCLRALRPDLQILTLAAPPTGLTVVTGLDRTSRVLQQRQAAVLAAYADLPYSAAVEQQLALTANTDAALEPLLAWHTQCCGRAASVGETMSMRASVDGFDAGPERSRHPAGAAAPNGAQMPPPLDQAGVLPSRSLPTQDTGS